MESSSTPSPDTRDDTRDTPTDKPEWITKKEAAHMLGVSERQIERLAAAGRIRTRREARQAHETTAPVWHHSADLKAIRAGKPNRHPVLEIAPALAARESEEASRLPKAAGGSRGLELLANAIARALPPAPPKPWLTLDEAIAFSGLPEPVLTRLRPRLRREGNALSMHPKNGKPVWFYRRAALDAPITFLPF